MHGLGLLTSLSTSPTPLSSFWQHSDHLASLLFLRHSQVRPSPGPLHYRLPLPRARFTQLVPCQPSTSVLASLLLPCVTESSPPPPLSTMIPCLCSCRTYHSPWNHLRCSFVVVTVVFSWENKYSFSWYVVVIVVFWYDNTKCELYTTCDMFFKNNLHAQMCFKSPC